MDLRAVVVILGFLQSTVSAGLQPLSFPRGFKWGAATAAYQVEGAWNVSDKSASIWDVYTHEQSSKIADGSNGDVACDSYNLWKRDIEMAKEMGLDFYRFSISWTRLMPTGFPNSISEDGRLYYQNLIEGLLENGIEPMVTLYHFDLPQRLQLMGGWTNPLISDWFAAYARVVFNLYGDKVKTWLTINEPLMVCQYGYGYGLLAPGYTDPYIAKYLCDKNVIMAHAKAYRVYENEFKWRYFGKISLSNQHVWFEPLTPDDEDITETVRQFSNGIYCHAIYSKEGGWPLIVEKVVAENSRAQGYPTSRLPVFTEEEKRLARGTFDFFALNHYTSRTVARVNSTSTSSSAELRAVYGGRENWTLATGSSWILINPEGIRNTMRWIKSNYGDVTIVITENGYGGSAQSLEDDARIDYIEENLEQVLLSIRQDRVNVAGYTTWSLMDNFEWTDGYEIRFGLYEVDFSSPTRERTPRNSARYYAKVVRANSLDVASAPEVLT